MKAIPRCICGAYQEDRIDWIGRITFWCPVCDGGQQRPVARRVATNVQACQNPSCQTPFQPTVSWQRFCSRECSRHVFAAAKRSGPKRGTCAVCTASFTATSNSQIYCSRPCAAAGQRTMMRRWIEKRKTPPTPVTNG